MVVSDENLSVWRLDKYIKNILSGNFNSLKSFHSFVPASQIYLRPPETMKPGKREQPPL